MKYRSFREELCILDVRQIHPVKFAMTPCKAATAGPCLVSSMIKLDENSLPPRCYWLPVLPYYITFFSFFFFYICTTTVELPLRAIALACLPPTCFSPLHHHLLLLFPHPVSLLTDFEGSSRTGRRPPPAANPDPHATPPDTSPLFPPPSFLSLIFSPFIFGSLLLRSSAGLFFHPPVPRVTPHELFTLGGEFCSAC